MSTSVVDFNDLGSTSLLTFSLHLTFLTWMPVEGQFQVFGSLQPIIVAPGDDIILPCYLEPPFNVEGLTVEWSKPGLEPDPSDRLSRVGYVHLYRDRREMVDMKIPSYARRTKLFRDELRRGNISLKILNVTLEDTGRYRCFIPKLRSRVKDSTVELVVDPNYVKTWTTQTPLQTPDPFNGTDVMDLQRRRHFILVVVFCLMLILVGGVGGLLLKRHRQEQDVKC